MFSETGAFITSWLGWRIFRTEWAIHIFLRSRYTPIDYQPKGERGHPLTCHSSQLEGGKCYTIHPPKAYMVIYGTFPQSFHDKKSIQTVGIYVAQVHPALISDVSNLCKLLECNLQKLSQYLITVNKIKCTELAITLKGQEHENIIA